MSDDRTDAEAIHETLAKFMDSRRPKVARRLAEYLTWDTVSTGGEYPLTLHICPECGATIVGKSAQLHIDWHAKTGRDSDEPQLWEQGLS